MQKLNIITLTFLLLFSFGFSEWWNATSDTEQAYYWIEHNESGDPLINASIWINGTFNNNSFYVYYNGNEISNLQEPTNVFPFFRNVSNCQEDWTNTSGVILTTSGNTCVISINNPSTNWAYYTIYDYGSSYISKTLEYGDYTDRPIREIFADSSGLTINQIAKPEGGSVDNYLLAGGSGVQQLSGYSTNINYPVIVDLLTINYNTTVEIKTKNQTLLSSKEVTGKVNPTATTLSKLRYGTNGDVSTNNLYFFWKFISKYNSYSINYEPTETNTYIINGIAYTNRKLITIDGSFTGQIELDYNQFNSTNISITSYDVTPVGVINRINQTPSDLTSINMFYDRLNITFNYTNSSLITNTIQLVTNTNSTSRSCIVITNGTCEDLHINYTSNVTFDDNILTNSELTSWTGAYPTESPVNWTVAGLSGTTRYVTQVGNSARLVSNDGAYVSLQQNSLSSDKLYNISLVVTDRTSGSISFDGADLTTGSVVNINSVGYWSYIIRGNDANFGVKRRSGITDMTFTNITIIDLETNEYIFDDFDDNNIYPATYNYNETVMEETVHNTDNLINANQFVKIELLNVSADLQYSFLEVMVQRTSGTLGMNVYYCNSTYTTGNPATSNNCYLFNQINNFTYDHCHSTNSCHILIPSPIVDNKIGTVEVTNTSYFLLQGRNAHNFAVYNIPYTSRTNAIQTTANSGSSWTSQTYTVDAHLHQFDGTETFYYQAFNPTNSSQNSTLYSDLLDLAGLFPTAPTLIQPNESLYYMPIYIEYFNSTAFNYEIGNTIENYTISLYFINETEKLFIWDNELNNSYNWVNYSFADNDDYVIGVTACDSGGLCTTGFSEPFEYAGFLTTALLPSDNAEISEGTTLFYFTTTNIYSANCGLEIDGNFVKNKTVTSASTNYIDYSLGTTDTYQWKIVCSPSTHDYTSNTTERTLGISYWTYNYNITLDSESDIFNSPQAMFYDIDGNLNLLYYEDTILGNKLIIQTLNGSTIQTEYTTYLNKTKEFITVFREPTATRILLYDINNVTSYIVSLASGVMTINNYTTEFNVLTNDYYDPYTYTYTKQYESLTGTSGYHLFMQPNTTTTSLIKKNYDNSTLEVVLTPTHNRQLAWQTLANNSDLNEWYYAWPRVNDATTDFISLYYYNSTGGSTLIATPDATAKNEATIEGARVTFEQYDESAIMFISNISSKTTIYEINTNTTITLPYTISMPSHFLWIDSDSFVFFTDESSTRYAYSCYIPEGNCTKISSDNYGIYVPYDRGSMTTSKRENSQDVIARGKIVSGVNRTLLYNLNTYDGKYRCFDEMDEQRLPFNITISSENVTSVSKQSVYGYVVPSDLFSSGLKRIYIVGQNGTNRLYLQGLTSNYILDTWSLNEDDGVYYTFTVTDAGGSELTGVTVSAKRFSPDNNAYVTIEQGITDFQGNVVFFLEPLVLYKIIVENEGYATLEIDFLPSGTTDIVIKLDTDQVITIPNSQWVFRDVTIGITEGGYLDEPTNITMTVASASSMLESYGLIITKINGTNRTVVYENRITTQPSGGTLQYLINESGTYEASAYFLHEEYDLFQTNFLRYQYNITSYFTGAKEAFENFAISGWSYYFIAIIISMIMGGTILRFSPEGAGVMVIIVLWAFTLFAPADMYIFETETIDGSGTTPWRVGLVPVTIILTLGVFAGYYLTSNRV